MKKIYTTLSMLAWMALTAATMLPLNASAQQNTLRRLAEPSSRQTTAHRAPLKVGTEGTSKTAYGLLGYDETDYSYTSGLVSFPLSGTTEFGHVRLFGDATHEVTAGAYANGYYYISKALIDGSTLVPS